MQWVYEAITKYTGVTDHNEIAEIYGYMSDNVRIFSDLSPAQLRKEAREAKAMADYIKTDAGMAYMAQLERAVMGA